MKIKEEVLAVLDEALSINDFPLFEISTWAYAGGKLEVLINPKTDDWLIMIQKIGYMISNRLISHSIICFSNDDNINRRWKSRDIIDFYEYGNLFDGETGNFVGNLFDIKVKILGNKLHITPTEQEYKELLKTNTLDHSKSLLILFFLTTKYRNHIMLSGRDLLEFVEVHPGYQYLLSTENWEHPAHMQDEYPYKEILPSSIPSFQMIAEMIDRKDSRIFVPSDQSYNANDLIHWAKDYKTWIYDE